MAALSPPGSALAAGSSGALVTASGTFTWARNTVAFNGVVVTSSAATNLVIDASGNVWVDSGMYWWLWNGTAWVTPTMTAPPMPVVPTANMINITGDVTLNVTGNVTVNGTVANTGTTTGGGTVTPPTNPVLQMPAGIAIGAPVTLGTGPDQIVLAGSCNPADNFANNEFSLVAVFGTAQVALTGPLICTSQVGEAAGSQVFTVSADLAGMTELIVQPIPGPYTLQWTNGLTFDGVGWVTDTDNVNVNSRSNGIPSYATSLFNSNGGPALWLPPNDPRVIAAQAPIAPPAATKTQITGAMIAPPGSINGTVQPVNTLQNLINAVQAGGTLLLPAGVINDTATVPVAMTISGVPLAGALGPGQPSPTTILDGTGVAPAYSKGALVPLVSGVVIKNLLIRNYSISATLGLNAAGVRNGGTGVDVTLETCEITGCQNGILTGGGSWTKTGCYTHDNGAGPAPPAPANTHEHYFNPDVATDNTITLNQEIAACGVLSTHALKTRACVTIANGGSFTGNPDPNPAELTAGSVVDIPNGGDFTATGTTFVIPAGAAIVDFLDYGMEQVTPNPGEAISLQKCVFIGNGKAGKITNGPLVPNATIDVTGSTYLGAAGPPVISGFASVTGTITAAPAA